MMLYVDLICLFFYLIIEDYIYKSYKLICVVYNDKLKNYCLYELINGGMVKMNGLEKF